MKLIFGLMLLKTAACLEFNCSFHQSDPCYAALGHKLNLRMADTSRFDLMIKKKINNTQDDPVCRVRNDRMKECDLFNNRPEVTVINGILIINGVIRADSGTYRLYLEDSDGRETSADLQVIAEASIGSVEVSIICSSSGVMRVSCSSDGDPLLFSWTLNGDPLIDGNIIDLDEGTDGNISCSVKNHISHQQKTISPVCPDGMEFKCWFNQLDPCYAPLGDKLNLLMVDTSRYNLKIQKRIPFSTEEYCRVQNDMIKECDLFNNRPEVTIINGTLIINPVIRADSGTLRLHHSDGTETSKYLQVIVEAPIGSVEVSIICSSSGVMRVSCSSDGDPLLFSWTLNGDPLMDGNIIELDEGTDGNISCSVKNHISHRQKTVRLVCPAGLEFNCWFDQADPCYAALGHKLNLLMEDTSRYDLKIQKRINYSTEEYCRVQNQMIKENECDLFNNRPDVTVINGTLIINRVIRADSGFYRLEVFGSDGRKTTKYLKVIVEAPIGSVEVSVICSSSGVMRVFCSSDEDWLLFSWTLNGDPLMDGNIIELDKGTDGNISCSVKNHVSHRQKTIKLRDLQRVPQGLKCLEFNCSFHQSDPCYAALGHKLNLVDTSRYDLKIHKRINYNPDDPVCRVKNGRIRENECYLFNKRPEVSVINGILIINGVIRADSGTYTLSLEDSDGTETSADLQVIVEAPIGSVEVSIICSSSGVMRASCSSDGDLLLFSWTLNGDPLMDGNIIDLDGGTDGNISCSVKNHVSHRQKTISVKHCPESVVFVLVWCFQMMFLLGLLGGFHIYMRHTSGKKQEDQQVRMSRFREGHEHTAED